MRYSKIRTALTIKRLSEGIIQLERVAALGYRFNPTPGFLLSDHRALTPDVSVADAEYSPEKQFP
jgi:hypothetical protein